MIRLPFGSNTGTQHDREQAAMQRLRDSTSDIATKSVIDLWEEYEAQATPEARFVKGWTLSYRSF